MPNQRACLACKHPEVEQYLDRRLGEGADLRTVRQELGQPYRCKTFGYSRGPSLTSLQTHQKSHRGVAPVSSSTPTFSGDGTTPAASAGDVASAIQQKTLEALAKGDLRITAQHGLKAQEMLDRRAEKAADRELTLVLARLLVRQTAPPPELINPEVIIEGELVGTADD